MSINTLTNDALARHVAWRTRAREAAARPFEISGRDVGSAPATVASNRVANTLNALVEFIPTEVVTLYVAAMSSAPALGAVFEAVNTTSLYWTFGLLTPALVVLLYMSKVAAADLPYPPLRGWPWWEAAAATIAFLVWALAVPGNPYVTSDAAAVVAGLGAVLVSTALTIVSPIFERLARG